MAAMLDELGGFPLVIVAVTFNQLVI